MSVYNKLRDAFVSALRDIAGLSEDEAKKELSAFELEFKKLAEMVEKGERTLEDVIEELIKKVETYARPSFHQRVQSEVKANEFVSKSRGRKVIPFSELVPISIDKYQKENLMYYFKKLHRYKSRLALSIYYQLRPVKHVEPVSVIRKKIPDANKPIPTHAEFEGFVIRYNETTRCFEYVITGDTSRYGKDFSEMLSRLIVNSVGPASEDSFCFIMAANVIMPIEEGKKEITEDGLGTLFSVLSLVIESCRGLQKAKPQSSSSHEDVSEKCQEYIYSALVKQLTVSEEIFYRIIENCQPPEGYVWARTPFVRMQPDDPLGQVRVHLKKFTPPKYSDTDLERKFEEILNDLGFKKDVDYRKQYQLYTYSIDFAFPDLKIAFEPGATYYHTPKWVEGEALKPFGFSPEEVYFPPKPEDIKKDRFLKRNGWIVGWLNENFVNNLPEVKKWISEIIENRRRDF